MAGRFYLQAGGFCKLLAQSKIKIYLVPDLENTTARVLVTNISHLYEIEIEGDLIVEKDVVAYIAYVEENGQLVPRVKFRN